MMNTSLEEMVTTETGLVVYINNSSVGKKDGFQLIGLTKDFTGNSTWIPTTRT
jgi:hypothetical protein